MNKRFLSVAASTAILASAIVFTGCGSSSSTTAAPAATSTGELTSVFVKGLWKNVPYRTSSTAASASPVTGYNGNFTFKTGDWVEFDLGLIKVNATAPANNTVVALTDSSGIAIKDVATNTTVTGNATVLNNVLGAFLTLGGNSTELEKTTGFDAATAIANARTLANAGLSTKSSFGTFTTALDQKMTTKGITKATGATDAVALTETAAEALKTLVIETAVAKAAALQASSGTSSSLGLNVSRLNNTYIVFSDKSFVRFSQPNQKTNVTGLFSTEASGLQSFSTWNASGSSVKLNSANMSNYSANTVTMALTGLTSGATATFTVGDNGTTVTKTVSKVTMDISRLGQANLTSSLFTLNITGTDATNYLKLANGTTFTVANTTTGTYNDFVNLNCSGERLNVSFDRDITNAENRGVLSDIVATINGLWTTLVGYTKAVLSAIGVN